MGYSVTRYHDFCAGHRVAGHENKCSHFHGHNYRIHFTLVADADLLDDVGRVIDFAVIKDRLCDWLEKRWDHKFLLWEDDPWYQNYVRDHQFLGCSMSGFISVPFNPTAENMARYLVLVIGPKVLKGTYTRLSEVRIDETRKCTATFGVDL